MRVFGTWLFVHPDDIRGTRPRPATRLGNDAVKEGGAVVRLGYWQRLKLFLGIEVRV